MSSITLKASHGYDAPWFVTDGEISEARRADMLGFVGLSEDDKDPDGNTIRDLTDAQVTVLCASIFQGLWALAADPPTLNKGPGRGGGDGGGGKRSTTAAAKPKEDDGAQLVSVIEGYTDRSELQKFFVSNRKTIEDNPAAMQALQNKFKNL